MQIIKSLCILQVFICPFVTNAQTTYLPEGSKEYQFIDRLEIKHGKNTNINFSTLKPYSRRALVEEAEYFDSARLGYTSSLTVEDTEQKWAGLNLTKIDEYNLQSLLMN